ncbi:sugar-binding transcriptional regulator [Lacticaseibacillus saniviri]|uniref:Central glycolyticproteinregulator n=1 Tax=Lacticaseibacillus saniviri JCM 17471 = DSM 24301 TaxID=1293598 RepID=A0A0R2MSR6_9LACO|nr:sugar-binding domain-containing protein [Lacticaseibacillus saniviri]KRO16613.1 central glycolyticproteinregulator [Lacticaseibacillus saniviri JCM 17471 = DSM 24301]MCG4282790.1 SorC family transcriptional regulator [Lacticaseibacillus saniviri]
MHSEFAWIEAIAPDMLGVITKRYQILQFINWLAPVGRRTLADQMKISERVLRTETDFLRQQGLVESSKSGMILTGKGLDAFHGLEQLMNQLLGVKDDEKRLAKILGIDHCLIVPGDADQSSRVLDELGKTLNQTMQVLLPAGNLTVAVMGGTTMARIAQQMTFKLSSGRELTFVPARGGVGEAVDIQANSVAAAMASATGSKFRVLYIPENVSTETYQPLLKEPAVKEVLALIDNAQVVIHSVGDALVMAHRRQMSAQTIKMFTEHHAVAETFGTFYDELGNVIYKIPRIGLQIPDLNRMPYVFAVAGGRSKARAIRAYMHNAPKHSWLITDSGAANMILTGETR